MYGYWKRKAIKRSEELAKRLQAQYSYEKAYPAYAALQERRLRYRTMSGRPRGAVGLLRGPYGAPTSSVTRAKRMQIARKRQRALIRAGLRTLPVSRAYYGSKSTGYVDLTVATYALDTTGSVTLIATIAQGAAVTQRVGKKVQLKSIQMRGSAYSNSATTITDAAWLIVYDKRPTGSLPAITDILVSANPSALNNDNNSGRFKILRRGDLVFAGNQTAGQMTSLSIQDVSEFIKCNRPSVFKALGTGAIGDIEEGALYLVTVGSTAAGTSAATLSAAFRVRFYDVAG